MTVKVTFKPAAAVKHEAVNSSQVLKTIPFNKVTLNDSNL